MGEYFVNGALPKQINRLLPLKRFHYFFSNIHIEEDFILNGKRLVRKMSHLTQVHGSTKTTKILF